MFNTTSLEAVRHSRFSQHFIKPLYASYCFANLPSTLQFLLTGEGASTLPLDIFGNLPTKYSKVILLFVDGFGWRFFEPIAEKYGFLKAFQQHGVVSTLTSQFPSTTAAHVTCIHTGLNVGQSGVYEWQYYEPQLDELINPLMFSYAFDKGRDSLKHTSITPEALFPRQTFYQSLKARGVIPYVLQSHFYTPSTYSDIVFQGANILPYHSLTHALTRLVDMLLYHKAPPYYYFLYYDSIDMASHHYGPTSRQVANEIDSFLRQMEQLFYQKVAGKVKDTLVILTADHGQVEVNPHTTIYLNREAPELQQYLQRNRRGKPIVPAGSARDMFLYIQEEKLDQAQAFLQKRLQGRAEIYKTADLVAQHFFGMQEPSSTFLQRVGNLVILPYQGETVWWYEENLFDMHFLGHHGGLTPQEMEIPLLVMPL